MKVEIYSDGSSDGTSTGRAGWSYVIVVDGVKHSEGSGGFSVGTNNIAEIKGASEGLAAFERSDDLRGASEVVLISDSQLVLNFATGNWRCRKHHLVP
jgi:ribonuclease HI